MSAAAMVLIAVIFAFCRVIGVPRARNIAVVVARACVGIGNEDAKRCARGLALKYTADDAKFIGFYARGGNFALGTAQGKLMADKVFVNMQSGCKKYKRRSI